MELKNIVANGEIARYEQFIHFPQCFTKVVCGRGVRKIYCMWEKVKVKCRVVKVVNPDEVEHTVSNIISKPSINCLVKIKSKHIHHTAYAFSLLLKKKDGIGYTSQLLNVNRLFKSSSFIPPFSVLLYLATINESL